MGIHLASERLKIEGFFGCHGNPEYTLIRVWVAAGFLADRPWPSSAQPGVQMGQQRGHLFLREPGGSARWLVRCTSGLLPKSMIIDHLEDNQSGFRPDCQRLLTATINFYQNAHCPCEQFGLYFANLNFPN
ncbi:MAG: hypothetical protein ABSG62_06300 [Terracidiphilus sp.]|jgi:hypothetical protein